MIGARNGVRPSLHEALTGGKMTVSYCAIKPCSGLQRQGTDLLSLTLSFSLFSFLLQPSRSRVFKGTPLKALNSDVSSPNQGRSVKKSTLSSWQEGRHAVVGERRRESVESRRAAVAAHRGL